MSRPFPLLFLSLILLVACGTSPSPTTQNRPSGTSAPVHDFLSKTIPITGAFSSTLPGAVSGTPLVDSVTFVSPSTGWAASHPTVPESGGRQVLTLWHTTDGGVNWTSWSPRIIGAPPSPILMSMDFLSKNVGYALGGTTCTLPPYGDISCTEVSIYKTSNGGHTFTPQATLPATGMAPAVTETHSASLSFQTPDVGYALSGGVLSKTTDAGGTWSIVSFGGAGFVPTGMSWISSDTGMVAGETCPSSGGRVCSLSVWKTIDGGQTFHRVAAATGVEGTAGVTLEGNVAVLTFVAPPNPPPSGCIEDCVPSASGTVLLSKDMGGTWSAATTVTLSSLSWFGPATFRNATEVAIPAGNAGAEIAPVGGGITVGTGIGTAAETWTTANPSWSVGPIGASGWALGGGGTFLVRPTSAGNWSQVNMSLVPTAEVDMVSAEKGFGIASGAVGGRASLLATSDGGSHWHVLPSVSGVQGISFVSPTLGWIASAQAVQTTLDGGKTFSSPHPLPAGAEARTLWALSATRALVEGGYPGLLWETSDGGVTWSPPETLPFSSDLVSFASLKDGWALVWNQAGRGAETGSTLVLEATQDGGKAFQALWRLPGLLAADRAVDLVSPTEGWVFVDPADPATPGSFFPRLLHTSDGGRTWTEIRFPEAPDISPVSLDFVNPTDGWLLTDQGGLLRTTDGGRTWTHLP